MDKVIAAMAGQTFRRRTASAATMDKKNHHLHKPVFIGEIKADSQFNVVWKTKGARGRRPWSDYIPATPARPRRPTKVTDRAGCGGAICLPRPQAEAASPPCSARIFREVEMRFMMTGALRRVRWNCGCCWAWPAARCCRCRRRR